MGPFLPAVMADVVIDVSHWQAQVDFARLREAGIAAAILKASEGRGAVDPLYAERAAAARQAGLLLGAYHFLDHSDGAAQADHFLATAAPDGTPCADLFVALDLEPDPGGSSAAPEIAAAAAARIREKFGRWPVIYVGRWTIAAPNELLARCPLWLPEYGASPVCPPGWRQWVLWQHTDGQAGVSPQPVPGVGACDRSRFAGSLEQLRHWWPGAAADPAWNQKGETP
ncbi:MAG TPA: glycoside hydrolase family 25 protein [Stellaceae bacterium]|nr:glycoside hydrolase family 25 protein [Stellaceae bacterium]